MSSTAGHYTLGPDSGTLSVKTRKGGAAAMAAHNLVIEVGAWTATLEVGTDGVPTSIELTADSTSLKVVEATGGVTTLSEDDKAGIGQTINEEVLRRTQITFRSSAVATAAGTDRVSVTGELELAGQRRPVRFELSTADGRMTGGVSFKQSAWGIKPYSALFGTLKVLDEITVEVDVTLPTAPTG